MAYNNAGARPQGNSGSFVKRGGPAPAQAGSKPEYQDNPDEVGIGYVKEMKAGGEYLSFTVTKDIPAGTKVAVFPNDKVKNRTEKTPTHKMKLSKQKAG